MGVTLSDLVYIVGVGVLAAVLIWTAGRDWTGDEPAPAAEEPDSPAQGQQPPGVLWVDGEPTVRYEVVPRFPRYFLN